MAEPSNRIISLDRYALYSNTANASGRKARIVWSVREGLPRLTVFTNDPADTDPKQIISVPVDYSTFNIIMDLIREAADNKTEVKNIIEVSGTVRDDTKKVIDKIPLGHIGIGRDIEGMVWISLIAENRPKIKFTFSGNPYTIVKKSNGEPMTPSEMSEAVAKATCMFISNIVLALCEKAAFEFSNRPKQPHESSSPKLSTSFNDDIAYTN